MPSPSNPAPLGSIGVILPAMGPGSLDESSGSTRDANEAPTFGSTAWIAADCRMAEAAGAGAIWASDHLFWRQPTLECLTTVAVAATATTRAALGTCVLQLPLRSAAAVAKQAAALQVLSGGRFVLGVGVGSHPGEYERAGVDYATRGRRLDEGIAALRAAWTGTAGGDYRLAPSVGAPVWVGGASPAAIERAATLADGWVPLFLDPTTFASRLAQLRDLRSARGGDPAALTAAVVMVVHVDADQQRAHDRGTAWLAALYGIAPKAFARHLVAGPAALVAEAAHRYLSSGATHVAVLVAADEPMEHFSALMEAAAPSSNTARVAVPPLATHLATHLATSGASA